MSGLINNCWFRATSGGTDTFTVDSALTGYLTPSQAGAYSYGIFSYRASSDDNTEWEIGTGQYDNIGATLSRTVLKSSNSDSVVNFTAAPKVAITALDRDLGSHILSRITFDDITYDCNFGVSNYNYDRLEIVFVHCQKENVENYSRNLLLDIYDTDGNVPTITIAAGNQTSSEISGISGSLFIYGPTSTRRKPFIGRVIDGTSAHSIVDINEVPTTIAAHPISTLSFYWEEAYGFEGNGGSITIIGHGAR